MLWPLGPLAFGNSHFVLDCDASCKGPSKVRVVSVRIWMGCGVAEGSANWSQGLSNPASLFSPRHARLTHVLLKGSTRGASMRDSTYGAVSDSGGVG